MPSHTNLVRRGATYYFRARVPKDLVHHYRRRAFLISLKTTDRFSSEHALVGLKADGCLMTFSRYAGCHPTFLSFRSRFLMRFRLRLRARRSGLLSIIGRAQAERRPRTLMEVDTTFRLLFESNGELPVERLEKRRRQIVAHEDWMPVQRRSAATVKKVLGLCRRCSSWRWLVTSRPSIR